MRLKHFNIGLGSQIFKSFCDESRIRIAHLLLRNKEMCISDLEIVLDFTQTKTSRHLSYLKNAGLVSYKKVDQWTYYSIKYEIYEVVELIFQYFDKDPVLQADQQNYLKMYKNKELAINKLHQNKWRR